MIKTNYDQLDNLKRIEKSSVNPIAAFDRKAWFPSDRNAIVESYDSSSF